MDPFRASGKRKSRAVKKSWWLGGNSCLNMFRLSQNIFKKIQKTECLSISFWRQTRLSHSSFVCLFVWRADYLNERRRQTAGSLHGVDRSLLVTITGGWLLVMPAYWGHRLWIAPFTSNQQPAVHQLTCAHLCSCTHRCFVAPAATGQNVPGMWFASSTSISSRTFKVLGVDTWCGIIKCLGSQSTRIEFASNLDCTEANLMQHSLRRPLFQFLCLIFTSFLEAFFSSIALMLKETAKSRLNTIEHWAWTWGSWRNTGTSSEKSVGGLERP